MVLYVLVTIYVCLPIKPLKIVHNFHTKISYSTKTFIHMEESTPIRRLKMVIFGKKHSDT